MVIRVRPSASLNNMWTGMPRGGEGGSTAEESLRRVTKTKVLGCSEVVRVLRRVERDFSPGAGVADVILWVEGIGANGK